MNTRLIQGSVLIGLVITSLALPHLVPQQFLRLLILAPLAVVFLLITLRWAFVRLTVVVAAGLVIPFSVGTGSGSSLNAAMLSLGAFAGLWVLERVVQRHPWNLIHSPTFTPLIGFLVVASLSFIVGQLPFYSLAAQAPITAQIGGLGLFVLSAMAYFWVAHQITELRWLELATWAFICIGALYVFGVIVPQLNFIPRRLFPYGSIGSLFWTWLTALVFSQLLLNTKLDRRWSGALGILLIADLYVMLFLSRTWSSGWIPPLASLIVVLWLGRPKLAFFVTLIGGLVLIYQSRIFLTNLIWIGDNSYSLSTRLEAWSIIGEIAKVSPVLGLGPANYYWYTPLFPIRGYTVQFNSHSQYVDLFAQTGILGLICFAWFVAKVGQLGFQLRNKVSDGFQKAYVIGALGGLAGMLVAAALGDWVLPFVYNVGFSGFRASVLGWLFLGGLVAISQINKPVRTEASE